MVATLRHESVHRSPAARAGTFAALGMAVLAQGGPQGCADKGKPEQRWQYHISQDALALSLPYDKVSQGAFGYTIMRRANSVEEREILRIAEAAYPDSSAVIKMAADYPRRPSPDERDLWWYTTFDDVRIPFALTAGSVDYYIRKMDELQRREFPLPLPPPPFTTRPHGDLTYGAWVEHREAHEMDGRRFENVWVVTMKLKLNLYFGSLSALDFIKERVVVIDADGRVLAVVGDGPTHWVVA